jgi:hypothetical protein
VEAYPSVMKMNAPPEPIPMPILSGRVRSCDYVSRGNMKYDLVGDSSPWMDPGLGRGVTVCELFEEAVEGAGVSDVAEDGLLADVDKIPEVEVPFDEITDDAVNEIVRHVESDVVPHA